MKALFLFLIFSNLAFSKVTVKDVSFNSKADKGTISVEFNQNLRDYPELKVMGKSIQVLIPETHVSNEVNKSFSFSSKRKDLKVNLQQSAKRQTKLKAIFAFNMEKKKDLVTLMVKGKKIILSFPKVTIKPVVKKEKVKKEFLNEAYLNKLLTVKDSSKESDQKNTEKSAKKAPLNDLSTRVKQDKSSFSLLELGGKMVAGVGLIILLFYGVLVLMKKGFIKKGKLGFLNNAEQISVIGQNFIAPKKSLMLIKAHNQVFLVSNTEHGIHPISEIKDAAGLLKDGEKSISGTNFDLNLESADEDSTFEGKVKIKEDITKSNQQSSLSSYLNVKDKVKFSDQIKKKVKSLKPLQ